MGAIKQPVVSADRYFLFYLRGAIMLQIPIQHRGIILREFTDNDIPYVAKIAATPGFNFYALMPSTATRAEIEGSAARFVHYAQALQQVTPDTQIRECYKLAVAEVATPEKLVGYVALDEWSESRGEKRDIGYFTDPAMQGKGYATLASVILLEQFFGATTYEYVHATVHPDNTPSRKILQKLGYQATGAFTKMVRGIVEPRITLSLHKDDFYAATVAFRDKTTDQNLGKLPARPGELNHV
ncbi:MAG: GNAT family N-acetyltransferase [Alphaproteobacteria bacterium]|nr:GNAT family N-acetyltransferase [Alphaproteobacteria bacterium]